jgi:DnaJ-domain-containing protein 1
MDSSIQAYFDEIPDKYLVMMAEHNWDELEKLCLLLTLDIEVANQERLSN